MMVVYVAGPISRGNMDENIRKAIHMADLLANSGFSPIIPQLSFFWQLLRPREYESWMEMDFALIKKCDALLRIPGESKGADREVQYAMSLPIPVVYNINDLETVRKNSPLHCSR